MINVFSHNFGEDQIQVILGEKLQQLLAGIGCSHPLDMPKGVTNAFELWRTIFAELVLENILPNCRSVKLYEPQEGAKGMEAFLSFFVHGTESNIQLLTACYRAETARVFIDLCIPDSNGSENKHTSQKSIETKIILLRGIHERLFELWSQFDLASGKFQLFASVNHIRG